MYRFFKALVTPQPHAPSTASPPLDWLNVLTASLGSPQVSPFGEVLPAFPPEELQRGTTGLSSEATLRQAYAFYENVMDAMRVAGTALGPDSKVLDFGFGWGRISRVFMRDVRKAQISGLEVDPDFVTLTRALFASDNFVLCPPFPPTDLPSGNFDLVFAYSVFSHLSKAACHEWMREFERILKPGGLVVLTTRDESFFDFLAWAASQPHSSDSYLSALGSLFPDLADARYRYRRGELVHSSSLGVSGGGPRNSSFYGETWIPETYARSAFGPGWRFVAGYFDSTKYDQRCFALQRVS